MSAKKGTSKRKGTTRGRSASRTAADDDGRDRTTTTRTDPARKVSSHERKSDRRADTASAADSTTRRRERAGVDFTRLGIDRLIPAADLAAGLARVAPSLFGMPLRRPDDLFVGMLFRENLRVVRGVSPRMVREVNGRVARLVLELPPQSFGEQAFLEATGPEVPTGAAPGERFVDANGESLRNNEPTVGADPLPPLPSARMRMARPSRIAFTMPTDVDDIPYSFHGILEACRTWPMTRALAAQPPFDFGDRFRRDSLFLTTLLDNAEYQQARASVSEAIATLGGVDIDRLARNAGERIAQAAAMFIDRGVREGVDAQMTSLFREELERVSARASASRNAEMRALVATAVGFHASAAIGELARTRPDLEIGSVFPIFPWLIRPQPVPWHTTQLEIPYRLVISPVGAARFEHETEARGKRGRQELWHTHLTTASARTGPDREGSIRAIWSDDYALSEADRTRFTNDELPFRMSLDPLDRTMLVDTMAGFHRDRKDGGDYHPTPSVAHRLHLTALGALLDAEGAWSVRPAQSDVEAWRHMATLGRDHYVRVVYAGFLWPYGHAASLIKVTERKFEPIDGSTGASGRTNRVAVLRQRFFIVVRETVKRFAGARHVAGGHAFPFTEVELLTRVTPNLVEPTATIVQVTPVTGMPIYVAPVAKRMAFWPMTGTAATAVDFPFQVCGIDRDGARSTFAMPLLFIGELANSSRAPAINAAYSAAAATRRTAQLGGSNVAFAPVDPGAEGDTRLPTRSLTFVAGATTSVSPTLVNVYPEVSEASVGIKAVQRLLSQQNAVVSVKYEPAYRTGGFGPSNPGEVFLRLTTPFQLSFGGTGTSARTDTLGALASPAMGIEGLSRVMGPAADLAAVMGAGGTAPKFDPASFFGDAKILGGIKLAALLDVVTGLTGADVPKLLSRTLPPGGGLPERMQASFSWSTEITKSDPAKLFVPRADGGPTPFSMRGLMSAPVSDPDAATFEADAKIENFKVNLFGFIVLWFIQLRFDVKRGQKPDVAVDMHPTDGVKFGGPLEFVNMLKDVIPGSGFSDPPSLSVTPSGIAASYSLNVPSLQVGIFALSNLSIGAGFSLPFDARPVLVTFNFSTREKPFSLTVSLLGGGGFFAIAIGAEGVQEIEAALEFGAAIAIDLGVASGGVEIKAGVYFHWISASAGGGLVELTGYLRLHGELSVLGLISASLTFNLQLSYLKEGSRSTVWGQATLTVTIDVLFFSADVSVKCRREFGGSPSDPTFKELVPTASSWQAYCLAYGED